MLHKDVQIFTDHERGLIDQSFSDEVRARHIRGVLLSGLAVLIAVVLFWMYGLSRTWLAVVAATILVISITEKVTYQAAMRRYETLIRKLVRRIEQLEGVPPTADGGAPTRHVLPDEGLRASSPEHHPI